MGDKDKKKAGRPVKKEEPLKVNTSFTGVFEVIKKDKEQKQKLKDNDGRN